MIIDPHDLTIGYTLDQWLHHLREDYHFSPKTCHIIAQHLGRMAATYDATWITVDDPIIRAFNNWAFHAQSFDIIE